MKRSLLGTSTGFLTVAVALGLAEPCQAQALLGLKVGESSTTLTRLGNPMETETYKGMRVRRWSLSNGNEVSVTIGEAGTIAYLESDWDGKSDDTGCDLPGLQFGITTLAQLRARFGSNGFGFESRGPSIKTPDGLVMMNSYEVEKFVITFYTKINALELQRAKTSGGNPSPADYARLDTISISANAYAKSEWGDRVYDPTYKKIEWK